MYPKRPIKSLFLHRNSKLNDAEFKKAFSVWLRSDKKNSDTLRLLSSYGEKMAEMEKELFGKPNSVIPSNSPSTIRNKGADTPLVETGELKSKVAHKNSINNRIVEGK